MTKFLPKQKDKAPKGGKPEPTALSLKIKRRLRRQQTLRDRLWLGLGLSGVALMGIGWLSLERSLPNTSNLAAVTSVRSGTVTVKSADHVILYQSGPATRENLKLQQIPDQLVKAFIATEDRRFYQHQGLDFQGILRAITSNVRSGEVVEGGSTITQQLARTALLTQERSALRKLKEARLSQKIEHQLSKAQILERYLNLVYLGAGAYGVADAAWAYFSKPVNALTLPEMATLAGLPAAPSVYSPLSDLEVARSRRNVVLERMRTAGYITVAQAKSASATPLVVKSSPPKRLDNQTPYFTSYIQSQLPQVVPPDELNLGGLTVETTLNLKWQRAADQAVENAIRYDGPAQGFAQAALVALDPRNGEVKAMVGGPSFQQSQFNRATQAQRQPGSTFKALVYTAAIAAGLSPYNSYLDAPYVVDGYEPHNFGKTHRGWVSMNDALTNSINVV
ncbi:MAG TPA: transglycosylase domain-containing protein, partial [Candidatus Caenarcaniphilales bacterium]